MDETYRKDFKMTSEDMTKLLAAMQPDPMIALQCGSGPTLQERANVAWKELGERMGFEHMSVRAPLGGCDPHVFSAIPVDETVSQIEKDQDDHRD